MIDQKQLLDTCKSITTMLTMEEVFISPSPNGIVCAGRHVAAICDGKRIKYFHEDNVSVPWKTANLDVLDGRDSDPNSVALRMVIYAYDQKITVNKEQ